MIELYWTQLPEPVQNLAYQLHGMPEEDPRWRRTFHEYDAMRLDMNCYATFDPLEYEYIKMAGIRLGLVWDSMGFAPRTPNMSDYIRPEDWLTYGPDSPGFDDFNRAMENMFTTRIVGRTGIPSYKFGPMRGFVTGPDEIQEALETYSSWTPSARIPVGMHVSSKSWIKWMLFLKDSTEHGGYRSW